MDAMFDKMRRGGGAVHVATNLLLLPPREGEKWRGGCQEGGKEPGPLVWVGGISFFVYLFHECCSRLGTS
jgi:hypothetical protein